MLLVLNTFVEQNKCDIRWLQSTFSQVQTQKILAMKFKHQKKDGDSYSLYNTVDTHSETLIVLSGILVAKLLKWTNFVSIFFGSWHLLITNQFALCG